MGYIYKATNKINNKIYVGQTVHTIEKRWKDHLDDCNSLSGHNYLFHKAIKKYGPNNFIIEQLEECDNQKLNERECYWIKILNSYYLDGFGYNMTRGGEGVLKYNDDDILTLWNQGLKAGQIALQLHASPGTITERLKTLVPSGVVRQRHTDSNKKSIIQYDLNGNFLKQWDCAQTAEKTLGVSSGSITRCCKKERTSTFNSLWKYTTDNTSIEELMITYAKSQQCNKVDMFTKEGEYIKTYESGRQAELDNNIARGSISGVCNHKWKTAGGYRWEWSYLLKRILIELREENK